MPVNRLSVARRYFVRTSPLKTARTIVKMFQPLGFHFYVVDLRPDDPVPVLPADVAFYADALDRLRAKRSPDHPTEFFRDRIAGATLCFLAEVEQELASVVWIYDATHHRQLIDLRPKEVELNASGTVPRFQGRGLYRANMAFALHWLGQQGYTRVWASAASDNPVPMKQMPRVGFRLVATIRRPSIFGPKFLAAAGRSQTWANALGIGRVLHSQQRGKTL